MEDCYEEELHGIFGDGGITSDRRGVQTVSKPWQQ
jgi:hypothetical protein